MRLRPPGAHRDGRSDLPAVVAGGLGLQAHIPQMVDPTSGRALSGRTGQPRTDVSFDAFPVAPVVAPRDARGRDEDLEWIGEARSGRLLDARGEAAMRHPVDDEVEIHLTIEVVTAGVRSGPP